eukprot:IDg21306t1
MPFFPYTATCQKYSELRLKYDKCFPAKFGAKYPLIPDIQTLRAPLFPLYYLYLTLCEYATSKTSHRIARILSCALQLFLFRQPARTSDFSCLELLSFTHPKMLAEVNAAVAPLRTALEDDALIEECAFSTAFERSFVVRRALHAADASKWLVAALHGARAASPPLRRLIMLVEMLATTEEGRSRLGRASGVGALVRAWRADPRCADAPAALAALCAGHIDNISRFMRAGGVAVACRAVDVALESGLHALLERALLLLGLAAVCTPDRCTGPMLLVPFIRKVVTATCASRQRGALAHAINVLANITECWRKEGRGFEIADPDNLAMEIAKAWADAPRNRSVVSAAAWALTGLFRIGKVDKAPELLDELLGRASDRIAAVRALRQSLLDRLSAETAYPVPPVKTTIVKKSTASKPAKTHRGVKRTGTAFSSDEVSPPSTPKRARRKLNMNDLAEQVASVQSSTKSATRSTRLGSQILVPVPASAFSVGSCPPSSQRRGRARDKNISKREIIGTCSPERIQDLIAESEQPVAVNVVKTPRGRTSKAAHKLKES